LTRGDEGWFHDHFCNAAEQVVDFLAGDGISLEGSVVADIGCGDGIIDLGIVVRARPAKLVGFDIRAVNTEGLLDMARTAGVPEVARGLPAALEFRTSRPRQLPADNASFDHVLSWSAFEHIAEPVAVLREAKRVLRPGGVLMIQLWPFFHSEHGSHLWEWFPEGFAHLRLTPDELAERVLASGCDPDWGTRMMREYPHLNRITLDDLQRALLAAGFVVVKLELLTNAVHIPVELAHLPLSLLGIAGVKLLAVSDPG
jgi:SAM-dependent methyltransferase